MRRSLKVVFELILSAIQSKNEMEHSCVKVPMVIFKGINIKGIYNNFNIDI